MSAEVRPLRHADAAWLADLHNLAFADYAVPAVLDASALASYMDETDVVPALSRVASVDGTPASFCLGALRGDRGSIRGEGTAPAFRRTGLGRRVLEETVAALADAGAREVVLEVLNGNDAAVRLYRTSGFEQRRRLLGYSVPRPRRRIWQRLGPGLADCESDVALDRLVHWGWKDAPWQLEPASLAHIPALALDGRVVAIGKQRGERFWLYALAVDPARRRHGDATRALASLSADVIGIPALVPEEWWEGGALLRALGAVTESHWQWEMRRQL